MKNDLINLFRWHTKVDIKDRDGKSAATLYIRLVGDVDYNQAQQYGLVASRKLRKLLRDENSAAHQSLFLDIDERTNEDLLFSVLLVEMHNFRDAAVADLTDTIFDIALPESDDETLEGRENRQEAEENLATEKAEKLRAKMEEKSNERRTVLEKLSIEELRKIFIDSSIGYRCLDEFNTTFREYCIFNGTYNDSKFTARAFLDFDEFRNISPTLKGQLVNAYLQLELSGEQLKN